MIVPDGWREARRPTPEPTLGATYLGMRAGCRRNGIVPDGHSRSVRAGVPGVPRLVRDTRAHASVNAGVRD